MNNKKGQGLGRNKAIQCYVTAAVHEKAQAAAQKADVSLSRWIARLVEQSVGGAK